MKVLLIDVNCKNSSTGKIIYDLYKGLNSGDNSAAISYGRGPIIVENHIYKHSSTLEVYFNVMMMRLSGYVGYGSTRSLTFLENVIDSYKPDIVHLHTMHGYHLNFYQLFEELQRRKLPIVYTLHDMWTHTGKCGYTLGCERVTIGCGNCPQLSEYPKSVLFDRTQEEYFMKKSLFDKCRNIVFVSVSEWLKKETEKSQVLTKHKIITIHNGIDTNIFKPYDNCELKERLNIAPDEKVIIHVTQSFENPIKGGRFVLELAQNLKEVKVKIIVIGNDDYVKDKPGNMIFMGKIFDQNELARFYSLADICLLTSTFETFSMICAESLCCGTPIIGFEAGAPSEVAPEGYGYFVKHGDSQSLQNAVCSHFAGQLKFMSSDDCSSYGMSRYSSSIMLQRYMDVYNELLSNFE